MNLLKAHPVSFQSSIYTSSGTRIPGRLTLNCSHKHPTPCSLVTKHLLSGLAASCAFFSLLNQVAIADSILYHQNICQLSSATDNTVNFPLNMTSDENNAMQMMIRGMSANNFDPIRYSGRWFEVASMKRGFAGLGQSDCHCTQGIYSFDMITPSIQVDTFCVHGGPDGNITGIKGSVQCLQEKDFEKNESDLEKQEMIKEKCYLRFPTLPFVPKQPYDVIATDYDNFSLVSGAKDRSFIQIYSRKPNPGPEFLDKYKEYVANFGYDATKIEDTPQDCEDTSTSEDRLKDMMQRAATNVFPVQKLKSPVQFNP